MNNLLHLKILGGIVCSLALVGAVYATVKSQPQPQSQLPSQPQPPSQPQLESGPIAAPHVTLNVQRTSGTCPKTVGLWWFVLPYEGGAEHTVVADTKAFADSTKLVSSTKQLVEFVSPLRKNYASCVGQTQAKEYTFYNVQFKNKQAYFRVDLRKINAPAKEIAYKIITASRPYVRWAIAD